MKLTVAVNAEFWGNHAAASDLVYFIHPRGYFIRLLNTVLSLSIVYI